jgi:guanyl-specific ribonuclease Sa
MMRWVSGAAIIWLLFPALLCRGGETEIAVAQGVIETIGRERLVLHSQSLQANSDGRLTLTVNETSRLSALKLSERAGKVLITQHAIDLHDFRPRQSVAVIYAGNSSGGVVLVAVARLLPDVGTPTDPDSQKRPPGVPAKVAEVLKFIDEHDRPPEGYEGGRTFHNYGNNGEESLPRRDAHGKAISYREWDVNPKIAGRNRGAERLITGSDGSAYYTSDHYRTFIKIR